MAKRKLTEQAAAKVRDSILDGSVGYGSPPKLTRFQKGVSGNPAGRPRKERSRTPTLERGMRDAILADSRRMVTLQEKDGQTSQFSTRDVVFRAQAKSALQGSSHAQEHYLKRVERAEKEEAEEISRDIAEVEDYIARCRAEIEAALEAGVSEPEFAPHPDDISIVHGKRPTCRGPTTREELEDVKRLCKFRDICLMQSAVDRRLYKSDTLSGEFLIAYSIDSGLPKRFRLEDLDRSVSPYQVMHPEKLRAIIRDAWQELGITVGESDEFILPRVDRGWLLAKFDALISSSRKA